MSVEILFSGGLGNNLFQYICARLFASQNGLRLTTEFNQKDVVPMAPFEGGREIPDPTVVLGDRPDLLERPYPPGHYIFNGYFQKTRWYVERRAEIERFVRAQPLPGAPNTADILMHLRLGDFKGCRIAIHPSWYLGILARERFQKLVIVTNEIDHAYLSHFRNYDPVVVSSSTVNDWNLIRRYGTILCSNSTFCWWAVFFSLASKVYTFKRWIGNPGMEMDALPAGIPVDGPFLHEA